MRLKHQLMNLYWLSLFSSSSNPNGNEVENGARLNDCIKEGAEKFGISGQKAIACGNEGRQNLSYREVCRNHYYRAF